MNCSSGVFLPFVISQLKSPSIIAGLLGEREEMMSSNLCRKSCRWKVGD